MGWRVSTTNSSWLSLFLLLTNAPFPKIPQKILPKEGQKKISILLIKELGSDLWNMTAKEGSGEWLSRDYMPRRLQGEQWSIWPPNQRVGAFVLDKMAISAKCNHFITDCPWQRNADLQQDKTSLKGTLTLRVTWLMHVLDLLLYYEPMTLIDSNFYS